MAASGSDGHDWEHVYFNHFTWCTFCTDFIWGVATKQGYKCKVCKAKVHPKCRTVGGPCPGLNGHKRAKGAPPPSRGSQSASAGAVGGPPQAGPTPAQPPPAQPVSSGVVQPQGQPQPNPWQAPPGGPPTGGAGYQQPPPGYQQQPGPGGYPPPQQAGPYQQQQQPGMVAPQPGVPQPGPPGAPKKMSRALFDFPPENPRELALKAGDLVEILQTDAEWWYGVLASGAEGFFPGNYVEKIGAW